MEAEAKKRQEVGINQYSEPSGNFPEGSKGRTRDQVAEAIGMSGRTYEKAKKVAEAAAGCRAVVLGHALGFGLGGRREPGSWAAAPVRRAPRPGAWVRLRAERRAGELLAEMDRAKGTQGQLAGRDSSGSNIMLPPENDVPTLADLGIGRMQSSRWRTIARMPASRQNGAVSPWAEASAADLGKYHTCGIVGPQGRARTCGG
jgi:hypothetical protein